MVTIQFANLTHTSIQPQYEDLNRYKHKTLPDYLKIPQTQYNPLPTTSDDDSLDAILNSKKDLLMDKLAMLGDIVFFKLSKGNHVGIYIGGGQFAHASKSKGVTVSYIDGRYWRRCYLTARRIFRDKT